MKTQLSYAEHVRMKMKTKDNPTGAPVTIRQAARLSKYSYEHWRKCVSASTTYISKEFNHKVCVTLGLDETAMWRIAMKEKLRAKFGSTVSEILPPNNPLAQNLWEELTPAEHLRTIAFMEGVITERRGAAAVGRK